MLLRTFLSKEPLETLDSSMTFDFRMIVRSQTFFLSLVILGVLVVRGHPIRHFLGCHWWGVKPPGGISRVSFPSSLNGP